MTCVVHACVTMPTKRMHNPRPEMESRLRQPRHENALASKSGKISRARAVNLEWLAGIHRGTIVQCNSILCHGCRVNLG